MTTRDKSRKKIIRNTSGIHPDEYAGTSMLDLLDGTACYVELCNKIHPQGLACGHCGSNDRMGHGSSRKGYPRYKCRSCGGIYTILSGTPFNGTRLNAKELILFMRMWDYDRPAHEIAAAVGQNRDTIYLLKKNLILHKKYNRAGAE